MDTTLVPHWITLRSGHRVLVRALRPDDAPGLAEAFEQLSETSRYRRFFTGKPHLSEQTLAYLTDIDHHDHEALVAVAPDSGQLVGVARFIRIPREPDQAEMAVTVADSWQRRGLGTALPRELAQRAARRTSGTSRTRKLPNAPISSGLLARASSDEPAGTELDQRFGDPGSRSWFSWVVSCVMPVMSAGVQARRRLRGGSHGYGERRRAFGARSRA